MKAADIVQGMRCHVGANVGVDRALHRSVGHVVEVLPRGRVRVVLDSGWIGVVACGRVKPAMEVES